MSAVKQEIVERIKQERFADALSVIKKNATALGGEAADLQEEVFTAWNGKAQAELDAHSFGKAAKTSDELIQAAPQRIGGYLRLADVSMADDSAAPFDQTLRRFWEAPRAAADSDDFIARLSELQATWTQRRVQQPAKATDFAAFAEQITQAEESAPKAMNGWLLAAKAECLMEINDAKPTAKELEQASAAIADPRVIEAGGYGQYVTARVAHAAKKPDLAGTELLKVSSQDPTLGPRQTLRRARAVRILSDAANKLRTTSTVAQTDLLRLDAAKNPFGTPENADTASRCLERASELATDPDNPLPLSLRVNQVLATWYKPQRDRATMRILTDRLLDEPTRSQLGSDAFPILLMNIDGLDDNGTKLERYATILDLASKQKEDEELPPIDLHDIVIEPAVKLGEELAKHGPLGPAQEKLLAQVHATKGKLILQHRYAAWRFPDKTQEAFNAFDSAIKLDAEHAEYFSGRAMAQSRLARPNLAAVEQDARRTIELDEKRPSGHGMLGYALLLQSRREPNLSQRRKKLNNAAQALGDAVRLCEQLGDPARELPTYVTSRSIANLELGYYEADLDKRRQHFEQAKSEAERAVQINRRYPENAAAALGHSFEAMAYFLGERDKYELAIKEFDKAVAARGDEAKSWLDRGRCRYKQAQAYNDAGMLDDAIASLEKATGIEPPLAEAFFLLGQAYDKHRESKQYDDSFRRATELAEQDQNHTAWSAYAETWANTALNDMLPGLRKSPPDPVQTERLRVFRAWASSHKNHPDHALLASWMVAQTYEAQNQPREALREYDTALPANLADAEFRHVKLLLARSTYRYGNDVLWKEDVSRFDAAEKQAPRLPTLRPLQAILDTDRAAELAVDEPATRAEALTLAAAARTAQAIGRAGRPRELELREAAVRQLEEAITVAPADPQCWSRRERLAIYLKAIFSDQSLKVEEAQRAKYRSDALGHLDRAIKSTGPTRDERDRLERLKAEIMSK